MAGTRPRARGARAGALALAWVLPAGLAQADAESGSAETGQSPRVELEKLLELPASQDYSVESRGGATPGEWRSRFQSVREALADERDALERAEAELEEIAGSTDAWQLGPVLPGGASAGTSEAPLDYQLRQKIRRHRDEIKRLERELRELEVEANLAGVPDAWREPAPDAGRSGDGDAEHP